MTEAVDDPRLSPHHSGCSSATKSLTPPVAILYHGERLQEVIFKVTIIRRCELLPSSICFFLALFKNLSTDRHRELLPSCIMATQTKGRVPNWREDGDQVLMDILVEHKVQHDGFVNGTFTKEAWRMALRQFNDKTHLSYTLSNLKNRFKNLKKWYAMYVNLKSRSGRGWDDEKNMPVPPSEDAWDEMIAINKDYKTLKGKSFNFMDQMHIITATSMARGDLGAGDFGNSYLDQCDEPNMDDDDLFLDMNENDGDPNPLDNQQPTLTEDIPPQTIDHAPTPNSTPQNNATVTQTSSRKKRRLSDSCNDSLEKIAKLGEERLALQKEALDLQKSVAPPVSSALDQLMKVDGIPDHLLYKAIDVMKGLDDRCIFLGLPVSVGLMDLNTAPTGQFLQNLMDEEDYWQEVDDTLILLHSTQVSSPALGRPMHTTQGQGHRWVKEVICGNLARSYSSFRVHPSMFVKLRDKLIEKGVLQDTKNMSVTEQLAIFLLEVGHGIGNRLLREWFQHSSETISRHFNNVLMGVLAIRHSIVHQKIRHDPKFYPFFKNALGAIDGTHISAKVPLVDQPRYRNQKGETSQNVMGCVDFDMIFRSVVVGWEGSAADMRVLRWALESGGFKVPEGKYFLVDAGYANTPEFLAPYRGIRYHLSEYNSTRRTRMRYRSKKDLFNHRHAQLRNVVEHAFGVLKARFTILVKRCNYPIKTQARIAMAYCVLHNFIRMEGGLDYIFRRGQYDEVVEGDEDVQVDDHVPRSEATRGDRFRNELATRLWIQHTARGYQQVVNGFYGMVVNVSSVVGES
ncbi:hypothetical protein Taro_037011 [Colocasia esculenta]|uniref:Transposase n=1 Tax=Colocasia esculenta TaxID=4460 RepID=A0A843WBI2_COLES|nr:hypothetical protein [Colocasia esculenta]